MNRIARILPTLCMAVLMIAAAQPAHAGSIDELMEKSGLNAQIESIPEVVSVSVNQSVQANRDADPQGLLHVQSVLQDAYDPDVMKDTLREHLAANLDDATMTGALEWLNSDIGARITQIEKDRSTPESELERQRFVAMIDSKDIPAARREIMSALDDSVGGTDTLLDVMINTHKAVAMSAMPYLPSDQRMTARQIDQKIEMSRPMMKRQYQGYVVDSMLFTYQELSQDELAQYLAFADSEVGTKYHKAVTGGLKVALTQAARSFSTNLIQAADDIETAPAMEE